MQSEIDKLKREYSLNDDKGDHLKQDHKKLSSEKLNQELSNELKKFNNYFDKHQKLNEENQTLKHLKYTPSKDTKSNYQSLSNKTK